ncbi:MAG: response regulator [bacterium]|nr:response regulator [bacterium]
MRRGFSCLPLLICFFCGASQLDAQPRSTRFDRITPSDGLSQSTVVDLLQDRDGFMWFGTQDGLNRYDGSRFTVYRHDPKDPASLPDSSVRALFEDESGDLWVGTEAGGLARKHADDTFTRYRHDPEDPRSLASNRVRAIVRQGSGALWIASYDAGLDLLDPDSGTAEHFRREPADPRSLTDDRVRALAVDRLDNLWIGTMGGLDVFDTSTGGFLHYRHDTANPASLSDGRVLSIAEDRDGVLWVGTYNGLNRFSRATSTFERFTHDPADATSLSENRVRTVFEDANGRLWVGTNGGLNLLDRETGSFTRYLHLPTDPATLSGDRVMSIYQDRGGVLWAGTLDAGVNKWNPITWSIPHYKHDSSNPASLAASMVLAFSEDRDDNLWIGTVDHGLDRLDRATGEYEHFRHDPEEPGSLSSDRITALIHDRQAILWVGTAGAGLNRFDTPGGTFSSYRHDPSRPESLGSDAVMSLFEDSLGELWVGTFGAGLSRLDRPNGSFSHFRNDPDDGASLSHDQVSCMAEDPAGRLWAGTFAGGLNRLDRSRGTFLRVRHDADRADSLSHDMVTALHVDSSGTLWIGTHGGGLDRLIELDPVTGNASFRNYSARDGLPNPVVWGILSEAGEALWIATNAGLARFDLATESFKSFDTSHGLQSNEFNLGASYQSSSGEMFFGGINGFNAFYPDRVESNDHVPPVALTSLLKFNQPVKLDEPLHRVEEISLDHRDSVFSFEFAALDYTAPEKNRYAYRLNGLTGGWIDNGHENRVTFTNLDPGSYLLHVKGSNSDGLWNEEELKLRLTIVPPWWRTWWAYTLYALALTISAAGYGQALRRKYQRRDALRQAHEAARTAETESRIKSEFLANMSHEIRTPMSGIIGMTDLLLMSELTDKQREQLETVQISGEALLGILNDILDFSKIESMKIELEQEPFDLRMLIEEALTLVAPTAAGKGLDLGYWIEPSTPETVVGDSLRTRQILMNLLSNGLKFTERGGVFVYASARTLGGDRYEIQFAVEDSGIGIPPDRLEAVFQPFSQVDASTTRRYGGTGLGLAICVRLSELMGGRVWAASTPDSGSTFHFTILGEARENEERLFLYRSDPRLAGRRALIVGENPELRRILGRQVDAWGMLSEGVSSATAALAHLQTGEAVDVAIVDQQVMGRDQVSWVKGWGREGQYRDLPLLLLTPLAKSGSDHYAAGPADHPQLSQPVKPAQLFDMLTEIVARTPVKRAPREQRTRPAPDPSPQSLRVLLAEDNPVNQNVTLAMLDVLGFETELAVNGLEVLEALEHAPWDVVLMDVQMPEMDGFEATREIHRLYPGGDRPTIVAMTAHAMRGYREKCLEAGMDEYIAKPIKRDPLRELLRRVEETRRAGGPAEGGPPERNRRQLMGVRSGQNGPTEDQ